MAELTSKQRSLQWNEATVTNVHVLKCEFVFLNNRASAVTTGKEGQVWAY